MGWPHRRATPVKANAIFSKEIRNDLRNRAVNLARNHPANPGHSRANGGRDQNVQARGVGGAEMLGAVWGVTKVADLSSRQNSFLLLW